MMMMIMITKKMVWVNNETSSSSSSSCTGIFSEVNNYTHTHTHLMNPNDSITNVDVFLPFRDLRRAGVRVL